MKKTNVFYKLHKIMIINMLIIMATIPTITFGQDRNPLMRKFIFNYSVLSNYLEEWQKDPYWTAGELKIFCNNCRKYLLDTIKDPENIIIIINESTRDITINGQTDLQDKFYLLPTGYPIDNKTGLYRQVKFAMEEAKSRGVYDEVFVEIRDEE